MNKIKKKVPFILKSGTTCVYYQLSEHGLLYKYSPYFGVNTWMFECSMEECACEDGCILRDDCYQNDIQYLTDQLFDEMVRQDIENRNNKDSE